MIIKKIEFVISNTNIKKCPTADKPEYAFIGRSNVGKSSLINMIANNKKIAKTSVRPGKTQLINHFIVNDEWYLVDLPGYGYAKISKTKREEFQKFIRSYILKRDNLMNLFVLIDSRHELMKIDSEFLTWLGQNKIPFSIILTKVDKLSSSLLNKNLRAFKKEILKTWEEVPKTFITSAVSKVGKDDLLNYIEDINKLF